MGGVGAGGGGGGRGPRWPRVSRPESMTSDILFLIDRGSFDVAQGLCTTRSEAQMETNVWKNSIDI